MENSTVVLKEEVMTFSLPFQIEKGQQELYARATDRFVALARDFLRRVDVSDADDIEIEQHFRKRRGFYFTGLWALTGRPPGAGLVDLASTSGPRRLGPFQRLVLEDSALPQCSRVEAGA
jgi:hypothetical protein